MKYSGWIDLIARDRPRWWEIGLVAVGCVVAGILFRLLFHSALANSGPFVTFFPAVIIAAIWGGVPAGVTVVLASTVAAVVLYRQLVAPDWSFIGWGLLGLYWIFGGLLLGLGAVFRRTLIDLAAAHAQAQLLAAEMQHRSKNLLAVVQALVAQTARRTETVAAFEAAFAPRLGALLEAQAIISERAAGNVPLPQLLARVVASFETDGRFRLAGPALNVDHQAATPLALILHELATNAIKHGALGSHCGRISLQWERAGRGVTIEWKESGGPAVAVPVAVGFGSRLLQNALPRRLGEASLAFEADGVRATIRLKPDAIVASHLSNSP
ncbi:sensor histidine kinase [Chelatococcus reniformis]|uniref:histidine kinase n=1 Tax=Chelatococcus reniformis TaxID=1494448 RepID=A0A916XAI8_9HYPH|nr:HWE histidine kinase domain-containing protein [Chelatococcus reniformis]GGC56411.1 hypothetical protein GCM10010994_14150 [Chelatococcus reniformis]